MSSLSPNPLKVKELIVILQNFNPESYVFTVTKCDKIRHITEIIEDEESNLEEFVTNEDED